MDKQNLSKFYDYFLGKSYVRILDDTKKKANPSGGGFQLEKSKDLYAEMLKKNAEGYGIFFTPNTCIGGSKEADVQEICWVFCDIDDGTLEDQAATIDCSPLEPTITVQTGRGHHLYWRVNGLDKPLFDLIMAGVIDFFGADTNAKNTSRLLRLPPFKHMKEEPKAVHILAINDNVYTAEEMKKYFPYASTETKARKAGVTDGQWSLIKSVSMHDVLRKLGYDVRGNAIWEENSLTSRRIFTDLEGYPRLKAFSGKPGDGSVIDVVMFNKKLNFKEAVKWLSDNFGVPMPEMKKQVQGTVIEKDEWFEIMNPTKDFKDKWTSIFK